MTECSIKILFDETAGSPGSTERVLGNVRVVPDVQCQCRKLALIWSCRGDGEEPAAPVTSVEQTIARWQTWEANRTYQYAFTFHRTAGEYNRKASCLLLVRPEVYLLGHLQPDVPLPWTAVPASGYVARTSHLSVGMIRRAEPADQSSSTGRTREDEVARDDPMKDLDELHVRVSRQIQPRLASQASNDDIDYVIKELARYRSHDRIISDVCERTGRTWDEASQLVKHVKTTQVKRLARRRLPLELIAALPLVILGLALTGGSIYLAISGSQIPVQVDLAFFHRRLRDGGQILFFLPGLFFLLFAGSLGMWLSWRDVGH